jgi:hypothetical protein
LLYLRHHYLMLQKFRYHQPLTHHHRHLDLGYFQELYHHYCLVMEMLKVCYLRLQLDQFLNLHNPHHHQNHQLSHSN